MLFASPFLPWFCFALDLGGSWSKASQRCLKRHKAIGSPGQYTQYSLGTHSMATILSGTGAYQRMSRKPSCSSRGSSPSLCWGEKDELQPVGVVSKRIGPSELGFEYRLDFSKLNHFLSSYLKKNALGIILYIIFGLH